MNRFLLAVSLLALCTVRAATSPKHDQQGQARHRRQQLRVGNCIGNNCAVVKLEVEDMVAANSAVRGKRSTMSTMEEGTGGGTAAGGVARLTGGGRTGLRSILRKAMQEEESRNQEEGKNEGRRRGADISQFPTHLNPVYGGYQYLERGECPPTNEGKRRFFCPTPTPSGDFGCVETHQFCDGKPDCPNGEDEDQQRCFFYRPIVSQLEDLTAALNRFFRPVAWGAQVLPAAASKQQHLPPGSSPAPPPAMGSPRLRIEPATTNFKSREVVGLGYLPPSHGGLPGHHLPPPVPGGQPHQQEVDFDLIRRLQADLDRQDLLQQTQHRQQQQQMQQQQQVPPAAATSPASFLATSSSSPPSFRHSITQLEELLREEEAEKEAASAAQSSGGGVSRGGKKYDMTVQEFEGFRKLVAKKRRKRRRR